MLNPDVEFVDIDPEHWLNLVRLVQGRLGPDPAGAGPGRARRRRTTLRLVVENGEVLKAAHSEQGLRERYQPVSLTDAEAVARTEGVDSVLIYERGTARRMMHAIQSRLTLDMNFVEQIFVILEEVRNEMGKGFRLHPRPKIPKLKYGPIHGIVKGIIPSRELILFVVYDDAGQIKDSSGLPIVTSIIVRINDKAELDLLTTTDSLITAGLSVSAWDRDYKRVNELAETVWKSKVFVALHLPLSSWPELVREAAPKKQGPKALLSLRKANKLIIDPFPLRFRALLQMGGMMGKK